MEKCLLFLSWNFDEDLWNASLDYYQLKKKKAKKKAIPTSVWLELFQQRMCRIYTSLAEEKKLLKA